MQIPWVHLCVCYSSLRNKIQKTNSSEMQRALKVSLSFIFSLLRPHVFWVHSQVSCATFCLQYYHHSIQTGAWGLCLQSTNAFIWAPTLSFWPSYLLLQKEPCSLNNRVLDKHPSPLRSVSSQARQQRRH